MDMATDDRKRFLDPDSFLDAPPQVKISRADLDPVPYTDLYGTYFMNQDYFEQQFVPQPQFQLQNWPQLQDSHLLPQQSMTLQDPWPGPSLEPWDQNPQHSREIPILTQLQLQLQIPLQFLSQRHDPFAIQRLIQLRLLMKPQHLPDPESMNSLDGLIGFNRLQIRKILIGYESEEYKEVLKVLEEYRELHSKRIELVKDAEFPENFLVKLYYKYHEIVAKSFEIPPNDMGSYQKWMFANINYHVGFRKIGQELQRKFLGASLSEITNFKMEKMGKIRRHKEELDPMFLRGFGEVQKELLDASRQVAAEQAKSWLPDWAHLPTIGQPQAPNLDPEEPTTSAIYHGSFDSNPWNPAPRIEGNGSSDENQGDDGSGTYLSSSASPEVSAPPEVLVVTPEEPAPVKDPTPAASTNMEKKKELAKLTAILINLIDNTTKLDTLKSQKLEILEKIERQEEILEEIGKERKERKERISELEKVKKEQEEAMITAKKEMEVAEKKYRKEVKRSKKFHSKIFAPEISGNILSDASDCIDAMDEDAYHTFLFYMNSRRELKSNIKSKQDDLDSAKNNLIETEDKIKETEGKLEELRDNEEKEIEKMREQEELLENNEKETKNLENEKLELEKQRKEQEEIVEEAERELVLTESKPQISDFEDEKSISATPSPEHPPELQNEDAAINSNSMCSFDSLDSAPVLSPHYPSSSPSPSSPSPSPPTDSSTYLFSQLGLLPSGRAIDSEGNILNDNGEVIGTCTMNVKLFIPNRTCGSQ
ncbi:hypothetical protein CAEBREN_14590 [Caenorhabditis brenneri]|uniref:Uncharacterized protein n=1 Tax=Caenorhabditis brenneri TaxID=135651 RepID=G0MCP2_CAEBE|nr:hypothetical protein CAEBREN_14590 [Caenorhabditis brenneri]